jgi:membrane associated rhomboid family serine protease
MIPLRILDRTKKTPYLTFALLVINILVFLWELLVNSQGQLNAVFGSIAYNPCRIGAEPITTIVLDSIRSMFLHGSWLHLAGNMLFLWLFGGKVEEYFGRVWFVVFYFVAGFSATALHTLLSGSWCVPVIGASGAISGILAAFLLLYPGVRVKTAVLLFGIFPLTRDIPSLYMLGYWFIMQLFYGITSLGASGAYGGVAFWGHIGGFIAGLVVAFVFTIFKPAPPVDPFAYLND